MRTSALPFLPVAALCLLVVGCHSASQPPASPAPVAAAPAPKPVGPPPVRKLVCEDVAVDDPQGADSIEAESLFVLMQSKLGGWVSCRGKKISGTDTEVTVTFTGGATLILGSYPSSDASSQEALVPGGTTLISRDDVIKALQSDAPADGCGIPWSKLSAGGASATGDFKASGKSCTMDVHVKMEKGSVAGFGFGVAA